MKNKINKIKKWWNMVKYNPAQVAVYLIFTIMVGAAIGIVLYLGGA